MDVLIRPKLARDRALNFGSMSTSPRVGQECPTHRIRVPRRLERDTIAVVSAQAPARPFPLHVPRYVLIAFAALLVVAVVRAAEPDPLAVGVAAHAFDHLGSIADQADAA